MSFLRILHSVRTGLALILVPTNIEHSVHVHMIGARDFDVAAHAPHADCSIGFVESIDIIYCVTSMLRVCIQGVNGGCKW